MMKVAVEHVRIGFSRVEVHPHGEMTELDQGANLGSDPCTQAQDGATALQRGAAGKVGTKAIQILAFHAAQPALDLREFAALVSDIVVVAGVMSSGESTHLISRQAFKRCSSGGTLSLALPHLARRPESVAQPVECPLPERSFPGRGLLSDF